MCTAKEIQSAASGVPRPLLSPWGPVGTNGCGGHGFGLGGRGKLLVGNKGQGLDMVDDSDSEGASTSGFLCGGG